MTRLIHDSAAEVMQELSILEGSMDRLRELLSNRSFEKNRPNASGLTPLMAAILRGGKEHVVLLVENGTVPTANEATAAARLHGMTEDNFTQARNKRGDPSSCESRSRTQAMADVLDASNPLPGVN